ncbi:hypothetical protein [Streptomyces sp. NPDC056431]|uniref:hypothetical protein n=1 Tax=Streptomyces sp. NPDC056431 TaxID=3345814 RepID=UPI0036C69E32
MEARLSIAALKRVVICWSSTIRSSLPDWLTWSQVKSSAAMAASPGRLSRTSESREAGAVAPPPAPAG